MARPFPAYKGTEPYIFVCYAHNDAAKVYPEIQWLHERGINIWYDEGIDAGTNWRTEIGEALENATCVLCFISASSLASDHCNREINYALDQRQMVLPVYLEEVDLTTDLRVGLGRVQALHIQELSTEEHRAKLLNSLLRVDQSSSKADAPDPVLDDTAGVKNRFGRAPLVAVVLCVATLVVVWWYLADTQSSEFELADRTIAVLPFETLGATKANAFTEGMHLGVLTRLSNASALEVISRTSVMTYRTTDKTLPQIARELGVSWVLRADVQEAGGEVQVNARLMNALKDRLVWAESYRRSLTAENVFDIQAELSKAIIDALRAQLSANEVQRIEQYPTNNLEAYRLHLLGRNSLDLRTGEGTQRAVAYFKRAIGQDPNYVLAWTGLADALSLLYDYDFEQSDELLLQAEQAVRYSLELDPNSAEAHGSLGLLHSARQDGANAIRELTRSVELRSSYAEAHNWLGWVNQLMGNGPEGLVSAKRAVALDPLSGEAISNLALSHLAVGEYAPALSEARHVLDVLPSWSTAKFYEGLALYHLARFSEAQFVLQDLSVAWADAGASAAFALALVASGDVTAAREKLTQIETTDDLFSAGLVYTALGETEKAFARFQSIDNWRPWATLAMRHFYPLVLKPIREDARYDTILGEINRSWGVVDQPLHD